MRRSGDATPLLHAMRIGQSHRDIAILIVGALSRFVNHLEDDDLQKPRTKALLKALRTFSDCYLVPIQTKFVYLQG